MWSSIKYDEHKMHYCLKEKCTYEMSHTDNREMCPECRLWRTRVRVEGHHGKNTLYVIIPAWSATKLARIDNVPKPIMDQVRKDGKLRFIAMVNTGAERVEDLVIKEWKYESS